ncbi:MAG: S9 family peptidase [Blastocatellia bacterium]|nr:S9 family peptidase [Blastocatellia bacterium]
MKIPALIPFLILFSGASFVMSQTPPVAKKIPKITKIHGDTLTDDYFWLREKSNPEVITYLKAENDFTEAMMKPTAALQDTLYKEMLARIKETDLSVPYPKDGYLYYTRTEQGKQYPIYCRKKGTLRGKEETLLDLNAMAEGKPFLSLGAFQVSNDSNLLAYSTDDTGFRQYKLHVKDLRTGQLLPDTAERITSITWANDNKTLFYVTEDATTKRSNQFYRHTLGSKSQLLFEEKDELYNIGVSRTRSRGYILLGISSSTTSEYRYLAATKPNSDLKVMLPREKDHEYYPDHHGKLFYIRTNDTGRNFRLVTAPITDPSKKNWKELIAHRSDVMLEDTDFFANHYVVYEREDGLNKFRVTDLKTGDLHYVNFPEPVYSAYGNTNAEFNTTRFRFGYLSFVTPSSVFEYDLSTKRRRLLKETEVLGGYDKTKYTSERIYATASDGTKVPISLVYKKGCRLNGENPLLLEGYGSYGIPNDVDFSSNRFSLLDRGFIYAVAHIRGGGDLGKPWHDAGKMMVKKNTFTDFIACAEHLTDKQYTSQDRLLITGGSAGGLLMGAVTNIRPELFKAVISYVPFVDVMNTMLDASLPLTVGEYLEWGNPNEKDAYFYMKSYSPYDNLEAKDYPTMLIRTSLNDSQVMYWEPAKYVAKLRAMKTDKNLLLFKTKLEPGGHGGASGRYDRLRDTAFDYAFMLHQVGITK